MYLTRILREISGCGIPGNEQFDFRPKHSTVLQLAYLVERVSGNFVERRPTDAIFLDVAKATNDGVLYNLTVLNFPSYLVKLISLYLYVWTFKTSV
jgi:hypothetical protein